MLNISDPLALLAIEAGQVVNPSRQEGAAGAGRLDIPQRSIDFGEAVPIVFGRRRDDKGGILISPGASECRFENDEANDVTAYYLLVLSEGRLDSIPVKDVFQKSCRVGTFTQTYSRRAGSWLPGNFIVQREDLPLPEATFICGSIGLYPDITTVSFEITIPSGFDQWNRQVHFFIRGGMHVDRLLTSDFGPSDNFADLIQWMLVKANRIPLPLIDVDQLEKTALFLEANGLTCNCWLQQATNYSDFIGSWAPYFLLIASNRGGKKALRPILPVNTDGTINVGAVTIEYTFTEDLILPGSFAIDYTNYADRQPFVAQMTWRQELGDEAAIIRTAEIRVPGTAEVGPYESYDLSEFCTSEDHAVKVGAYIVADRLFTTHSIRFAPRPELHTTLLGVGSIIRVLLTRETADTQPCTHDYLYQIQRISKTFAGDTQYECRHFPVDSQRRSIVALNVANAFGTGILLTSAKTGVSCDLNSPTDNTIPFEEFVLPGFVFDPGFDSSDFDFDIGDFTLDFDPSDLDPSLDYSFRVEDGTLFLIDEIDSTDFGTEIAVGGDLTGISDLGDLGSFGDIGGGGTFDGGLGEVEENPTDAGDAEPLGSLTPSGGEPGDDQCGVEEFETPEGTCPGGKIIYTTADLDSDGNVIDGTIRESERDTFSIPIADFRNFASFSFRVVCGDGSQQYTEPILCGEPDPFIPVPAGFIGFSVTLTREQSAWCSCNNSELPCQPGSSSSVVSEYFRSNVASYAVGPAGAVATLVCPPEVGANDFINLGTTVRYINGTEEFIIMSVSRTGDHNIALGDGLAGTLGSVSGTETDSITVVPITA
jgi:hypothetical protein